MKRKIPLVNGEVYHILSRSIAGYKIFNGKIDYLRMQQMLKYYQKDINIKFSFFTRLRDVSREGFNNYYGKISKGEEDIVQIIAYCLMPTHIHLILKQLTNDGISRYCGNILNSYTHYFNSKHERKGPLWEGKFKNILIKDDKQLLHLSRYIHLNPATAKLVNKPEKWEYSSYREYLNAEEGIALCDFQDILELKPSVYREFVNDRIAYQRELAKIKALFLD